MGLKTECIVCKKQLEPAFDLDDVVQPSHGLAFTSQGHYGSTVFDPLDGSYIEIVVCDECLQEAISYKRVYLTTVEYD